MQDEAACFIPLTNVFEGRDVSYANSPGEAILMPAVEVPNRLFSWQVATPDPERGACGIASEKARAVHDLAEAMRATGGTCGIIQICQVSQFGPFYEYGRVVGHIEIDEGSGRLVVRESHRGSVWLDPISALRGRAVAPCPSNSAVSTSNHMPTTGEAAGLIPPAINRPEPGSR